MYSFIVGLLSDKLLYAGVALVGLLPLGLLVARWGIFLLLGIAVFFVRSYLAVYHGFRIVMDTIVLTILKLGLLFWRRVLSYLRSTTEMRALVAKMRSARNYDEWQKYYDENEALRQTVVGPAFTQAEYKSLQILMSTTARLRELRLSRDHSMLMHEIPSIVKRNYLGIDDIVLDGHHVPAETYDAIMAFNEEICECIRCVCGDDPLAQQDAGVDLDAKITFLKKLSRNIGHSALCLSGGGAICMYHLGVLRALVSHGLYSGIHVISGASGGSIGAAMCATCTEDELKEWVLQDNVSTDFRGDGSMRRHNITWFPPLLSQMIHFVKTGYLVDNAEFCRTCEYYWGDVTFAEAYGRTNKHVCIAVTASNAGGGGPSSEKLLLNHMSTPHVLIRSAVAASCALPGIMRPNKLLCKTKHGDVVPFESDGSHWVDGSIGADVPFKRMSALFSVSNFIVSQVNFHIVPFVSHRTPHGRSEEQQQHSALKMLMAYIESDLAYRTEQLRNMKLLPRLYGQEIGGVFKQKYHGHITLVPELRWGDAFGMNAIRQPSRLDMQHYLHGGQLATWSGIRKMQHVLCIEKCIWDSLAELVCSRGGFGEDSSELSGTPGAPSILETKSSKVMSVSDLLVYGQIDDRALSRSNSLTPGGGIGLPLSRGCSTPGYNTHYSDENMGTTPLQGGREADSRFLAPGKNGKTTIHDSALLERIAQLEAENIKLKARLEVAGQSREVLAQ